MQQSHSEASTVLVQEKDGSRRRVSWFGVLSTCPPAESLLFERLALAKVSEIRWCKSVEQTNMYQWFLYSRDSMYLKSWERLAKRWTLIPSFNSIDKNRNEKLWMLYLQSFGGTCSELSSNVVVLDRAKGDDNEAPPQKKPKTTSVVRPVLVSVHTTPEPRQSVQESGFVFTCPESLLNFLNSDLVKYNRKLESIKIVRSLFAFCKTDNRIKNFLSTTNPFGMLRTYPQPAPECSTYLVVGRTSSLELHTTTLELHRRTLKLEDFASLLGRALHSLTLLPDTASRASCLDTTEAHDLVCCLVSGCGRHGVGVHFWPSDQPNLDALPNLPAWPFVGCDGKQSRLKPLFDWMTTNRDNAFTRSYLIVDEVSWVFPIICHIVVFLKQAGKNRPTASQLMDSISGMLEIRASIVHQERGILLRYGGAMTCYCRRLQAIYSKLTNDTLPSHMQVSVLDQVTGGYIRVHGDASVLPIDVQFHQPVASISDIYSATKRRKKQVIRNYNFFCILFIVSMVQLTNEFCRRRSNLKRCAKS